MPKVFINYRRGDSAGMAGRLYDHLTRSLPKRDVFMDVDAMKPGRDFVRQLEDQVAQCDVLLAVIGTDWHTAADAKGNRRITLDNDYVRTELATALRRDIPVIPILVDGAAMPDADELPADLKPLVRRHAIELRHARFAADAELILEAVQPKRPRSMISKTARIAAGVVIACSLAITALFVVVLYKKLVQPEPVTVAAPTPPQKMAAPAVAPPAAIVAKPEAATATARAAPAPESKQAGPSDTAQLIVEGLKVALGDSMAKVRAAYDIKDEPTLTGASGKVIMLRQPRDGLFFFFTPGHILYQVRMDAPFAGSQQGARVGDPLATLLQKAGPPRIPPWDFGTDKAYNYKSGLTNYRYDVDRDGRVVSMMFWRDGM